MKTEKEIREKLKELSSDDRIPPHQKIASIQINAPLALIQLSINSRIDALKWVLGNE